MSYRLLVAASSLSIFSIACSPQGHQQSQSSHQAISAQPSDQKQVDPQAQHVWLRADLFKQLDLPMEQVRCGDTGESVPSGVQIVRGQVQAYEVPVHSADQREFSKSLRTPYKIHNKGQSLSLKLHPSAGAALTVEYTRTTPEMFDQAKEQEKACLTNVELAVRNSLPIQSAIDAENRIVFEKERFSAFLAQQVTQLKKTGNLQEGLGIAGVTWGILFSLFGKHETQKYGKLFKQHTEQLGKTAKILEGTEQAVVNDLLSGPRSQVAAAHTVMRRAKAIHYGALATIIAAGILMTKGHADQSRSQHLDEVWPISERAFVLISMPETSFREHIAESPEDQELIHDLYISTQKN